MGADCEAGVEEQNATVGPGSKQAGAIGRWRETGIVGGKAFVNVNEGGWCRGWFADRKAEAVSLSVIVIWVLADDNCFHSVERSVAGP